MNLRSSLLLFIGIVLCLGFQGQEEKIKSLIKDLSAPEYSVRENAKKELIKIGKPAIEHLKNAINGDDVELSEGASEVLSSIMKKEKKEKRRSVGGFYIKMTQSINGDVVTVESGPDKFKLDVKTKDKIESCEARDKEEFKTKCPEFYKRYKNFIESVKMHDDVGGGFLFKNDFEKRFKDLTKSYKHLFEDDFFFDENDLFSFNKELDDILKRRGGGKTNIPDDANRSKTLERSKGNIGITLDLNSSDDENNSLVKVSKLNTNSKLYDLGLREGDVLKFVNGNKVISILQARKLLINILETGGSMVVLRSGGEVSLDVGGD